MRKFTDKENQIIKSLVNAKVCGDVNGLDVANLLKQELTCFALKWEIQDRPNITIYSEHQKQSRNTSCFPKIDNNYLRIADFIYFIEELCDCGFVKLQQIPTTSESSNILYDKDEFIYNEDEDRFESTDVGKECNLNGETYVLTATFSSKDKLMIYSEFANDLDRCANSLVYPLPLAKDYVDNGFKLLEQLQFDEQIHKAQKSLFWSRSAFIVALITLLATLFIGLKQLNSSQRLDEMQFKEITNDIKESHSMLVSNLGEDSISVNNIDCMVLKPI